jgi:hypothetical protein
VTTHLPGSRVPGEEKLLALPREFADVGASTEMAAVFGGIIDRAGVAVEAVSLIIYI